MKEIVNKTDKEVLNRDNFSFLGRGGEGEGGMF